MQPRKAAQGGREPHLPPASSPPPPGLPGGFVDCCFLPTPHLRLGRAGALPWQSLG